MGVTPYIQQLGGYTEPFGHRDCLARGNANDEWIVGTGAGRTPERSSRGRASAAGLAGLPPWIYRIGPRCTVPAWNSICTLHHNETVLGSGAGNFFSDLSILPAGPGHRRFIFLVFCRVWHSPGLSRRTATEGVIAGPAPVDSDTEGQFRTRENAQNGLARFLLKLLSKHPCSVTPHYPASHVPPPLSKVAHANRSTHCQQRLR